MKFWCVAVLISLVVATAPLSIKPWHATDEVPSFCTLDVCGSAMSITADDTAVIFERPDASILPCAIGSNVITDPLLPNSPYLSGEPRPPRA